MFHLSFLLSFVYLIFFLSLLLTSDEVHRFESNMKVFVYSLEDGVDVTMWQMNRSEEKNAPAEFALKASHVTVRLQRRGDLRIQGMVNFTVRGGYLSKAIGRSRGGE